MTHAVRLVKSKERRSREELADMLVALAERIRAGRVRLTQADREVLLELPETMQVDLEVEEQLRRKGMKREIEIEISWYEGAEGPLEDSGAVGIG